VKATALDLEILRKGWFGSLPEALQSRIVAGSRTRSFRKGEFLIRQGDAGRGMHGLLAGRTHHLRQVSEADEVLLHVGEPGLWVGEYPLLSGDISIGSVFAATPVRTLFLPAREYEQIIDDEPRYLRYFCRLLAHRFAVALRALTESHRLAPEDWLLSRLQGILELQRTDAVTGPRVDKITLSQSELANMVGLSRQTLSVLLGRLVKRTSIEVGYRSIRVLGEPAIQRGR
jgi:CRP-like cAMP-binding protein